MIQVQITSFEDLAAILAGIAIALENIVPRKFNLFLGQSIEEAKQYHPWDAELERNRVNALGMRCLLRKVAPLRETVSLK